MGSFIEYKCEGCGYSFKAAMGFGFGYPSQFQGAVEAARKGQYGKEYRRKILFHEGWLGRIAAIDLTRAIAQCEDCGAYQAIVDDTLYVLPRKSYPGLRIWTGSQKEFFITPEEMRAHGKVVGEIDHRCQDCGGRLCVIEGEPKELPCPKCGSMMMQRLDALWD